LWNGGSYYEAFRTRGVLELKEYGSWEERAGLKEVSGVVIARDSTDIDGYYCFRNVEPGEYMVHKLCPSGTTELLYVYAGPILAQADHTYWVEMDPYYGCTR